jgi:hypothetical protein
MFQKVYGMQHAVHIPFEDTSRLDMSFLLPHTNYGKIVFTGADLASDKRLSM